MGSQGWQGYVIFALALALIAAGVGMLIEAWVMMRTWWRTRYERRNAKRAKEELGARRAAGLGAKGSATRIALESFTMDSRGRGEMIADIVGELKGIAKGTDGMSGRRLIRVNGRWYADPRAIAEEIVTEGMDSIGIVDRVLAVKDEQTLQERIQRKDRSDARNEGKHRISSKGGLRRKLIGKMRK